MKLVVRLWINNVFDGGIVDSSGIGRFGSLVTMKVRWGYYFGKRWRVKDGALDLVE